MAFKYISSLLILAVAAVAQKCPLQFDGRVPAGSTPASFDLKTSPFGTSSVFGQSESFSAIHYLENAAHTFTDLTFSKLIKLPAVTPSLVSSIHKRLSTKKLTDHSSMLKRVHSRSKLPYPMSPSSLHLPPTSKPASAARSSTPPATTAPILPHWASRPCTSVSRRTSPVI